MDDRKKIIMENHGSLTYETARKGLRLLGAKSFNELQQNQPGKKLKTYDCNYIENEEEVPMTEEGDYGEWDEEWVYQALLERDERAQFCHEFEEQIMLTCQESSEIIVLHHVPRGTAEDQGQGSFKTGFWPVGTGEKGKGKSKGKFKANKGSTYYKKHSLADRLQPGHWKRECPNPLIHHFRTIPRR